MSDYLDNSDDLEELQQLQEMQAMDQGVPDLQQQPAVSAPPPQIASQPQPRFNPPSKYDLSSPPPQNNQDDLKAAQAAADKRLLFANLGRAVDTAASGIGAPWDKNDQSFYEQAAKDSNKPVQNLLDAGKLSKNQDLAAWRQAMLKKHGVELDQKDQRLAQGKDRLDLAGASAGARVAGKVVNDKIISQIDGQKLQLDKDADVLQNSPKITPGMLDELAQGYAGYIAGARAAAVSTIESQKIHDFEKVFADAKQYITSHPQEAGNDDFKILLANQIRGAKKILDDQRDIRGEYLQGVYGKSGNKHIDNAVKNAITAPRHHEAGSGQIQSLGPETRAKLNAQKINEAADWIEKNPNDPKVPAIRRKIIQLRSGG